MKPSPYNLLDSFLYYTECQLATVEQLEGRKSASKANLRRQRDIASGMVEACKNQIISGNLLRRIGCPRLVSALGLDRVMNAPQ